MSLLSDVGRSQLGKKHKDVIGAVLPTFEQLRQKGGLVLYETKVNEFEDLLTIKRPHDIVYVFVDGVSIQLWKFEKYLRNLEKLEKYFVKLITLLICLGVDGPH